MKKAIIGLYALVLLIAVVCFSNFYGRDVDVMYHTHKTQAAMERTVTTIFGE